MDLFIKWRKDFSLLHIDLVKGNHDILEDNWYNEANIECHELGTGYVNHFFFVHDIKTIETIEKSKRMQFILLPVICIRAISYEGTGQAIACSFPVFILPKNIVFCRHSAVLQEPIK